MNKDGVINSEALRVFKILKEDSTAQLDDVINTLILFQEYLSGLCDRICRNGLKDAFINQWVFSNKTRLSQKDYESYCKANLFAASSSLERILPRIVEEKRINEVQKRMLTDFICDLKPFVKCFDDEQDYSWLLCNTNSHITNFYFELSNNLFWNGASGNHPEEKLVLATSTPFLIRQSIEYKIKRILGIDYILINGKPDIRCVDKFFKAIECNKKFYQIRNFDFKTIKQIHSWTHTFIHGGYRPEPWQTETALNCLKELFYSGETSQKKSWSLYAGVEVKQSDLEDLKNNTEETIKEGITGDVYIKWSDPEIAIQ